MELTSQLIALQYKLGLDWVIFLATNSEKWGINEALEMGLEINRYINARDVINDAIDRSSEEGEVFPVRRRLHKVMCLLIYGWL